MTPTPLPIVQDSREQIPWRFSERCEVTVGCLPFGDYSVAGFESRWAVERKSVAAGPRRRG